MFGTVFKGGIATLCFLRENFRPVVVVLMPSLDCGRPMGGVEEEGTREAFLLSGLLGREWSFWGVSGVLGRRMSSVPHSTSFDRWYLS